MSSDPPISNPPSSSEEINPPIIIQKTPYQFNLYSQTIQLLQRGYLCLECLGRQYSYLGTSTDNTQRASSLLLGLMMECDQALSLTESTHRYFIFDQSPLYILDLIASRTPFYQCQDLLLKFLDERPDLFSIEEQDPLIEKYKGKTPLHLGSTTPLSPNFKCYLCENLLLPNSIEKIAENIVEKARGYEFQRILVGTLMSPIISNREEDFRARFQIKNGESFKANLNRLVGKQLTTWWTLPVDFLNPDITFLINLNTPPYSIEIQTNALYILGSYLKFVRNLPQTQWICPMCRGEKIDYHTHLTCENCHGEGKIMPVSIEELIAPFFLNESLGKSGVFHGAGREDFDVRCLGTGRPFIFELKNPIRRTIDLQKIKRLINETHGDKISLQDLKFGEKADIGRFKENIEQSTKIYHALIYCFDFIDPQIFETKMLEIQKKMTNKIIYQRTPLRVVHRRIDKTREKKVFTVEGKYIDPCHFFVKIKSQGGTYIKELITGDENRTSPSFSDIFNIPLVCVELDVVEIDSNQLNSPINHGKKLI